MPTMEQKAMTYKKFQETTLCQSCKRFILKCYFCKNSASTDFLSNYKSHTKMKMIRKTIVGITLAISTFAISAADFDENEVEIINTADNITLAGTLTYPHQTTPKAAIVMATGSGAQNRDEELLGHKPFKVIAEYLSANGYAVLRMDDRGTAKSSGDFKSADNDDLSRDISSGLSWLKERYPETGCGIIGHSDGGATAIKEAAGNRCDFIITIGAPAWVGDSIIMSQSRKMATMLTGKWDAETSQRMILDIVKSDLSNIQASIALRMALQQLLGPQAELPQAKEYINAQLDILLSRWYRGMVKYDPATDISRIKVPWLALNGSLDTQVLPENLETIKQLCQHADTVIMPGHNHLMQHATTGLPDEYGRITEDISQQTLSTILSWLNTHFNQPE